MILTPRILGHVTQLDYQWPAHLERVSTECLRLVTDPLYNRLLIRIPVRHGKSYFVDFIFPSCYLLTHPTHRIILATHTVGFSEEWTGRSLNLIQEYGSLLTGVELDPTHSNRSLFRTKQGGEMRAVGVGSSCAGAGADLVLFDDLHASQEDANSPVMREKLATWFSAELLTRLEPRGKVIGVASARHPEDQIARLLAQNAELPSDRQWNLIKFPALDDAGNALWPERYGPGRLAQIREELEREGKGYLWQSLYQQNPMADPAALEWPDSYFEGIWYTGEAEQPRRCRVMAFDPSVGKNCRTSDYPAIVCGDYGQDNVLRVVESYMQQVPIEAAEDQCVGMLMRLQPDALIVEANGFQELVAKNVMRKLQERSGRPVRIDMVTVRDPKEVRIRLNLGPLMNNHRFQLRDTAGNRTIYNQLRNFPSSEHDDGPDACSLLVTEIDELLGNR